MQICESGDERHENMVEETCESIVRRAPKGYIRAFRDDFELMPQWCCEFLVVDIFRCCSEAALCFQLRDVVFDIIKLHGISKNVGPLSITDPWGLPCSDDIQHPIYMSMKYISVGSKFIYHSAGLASGGQSAPFLRK